MLNERQILIIDGLICPYCGKESKLIDSVEVYKKSYGMMRICKPCDAYVGCHKGTDKPKGRLANKKLRFLKKKAHKYFDMIWKDLKLMSRNEAYKWLSEHLEIPSKYTHIGMFGADTCKEVIRLSKQLLNDNRRLDLDFGAEPKTPYYETN